MAGTRRTVWELWAEANEKIEVISPQQLSEELEVSEILLLDVRLPIEAERRGTIAGSTPVPRQVVEWWADPESLSVITSKGPPSAGFDQKYSPPEARLFRTMPATATGSA